MLKTLNIDIAELIYDIENKTFLTGRARANADNHLAVANMQANADPENRNQIIRSIISAFDELHALAADYMRFDIGSLSNTLDFPAQNIAVNMTLPANFNSGVTSALANCMHDYIVARAVADWFKITDKTDADDYSRTAADVANKFERLISMRSRPARPSDTGNGSGDGAGDNQEGPDPGITPVLPPED